VCVCLRESERERERAREREREREREEREREAQALAASVELITFQKDLMVINRGMKASPSGGLGGYFAGGWGGCFEECYVT